MFKKLLGIIALVALLAGPASAENRIDWVTGIQPPANWLLQENLNSYEAQGQLIWDLIGRNNTNGFFTNLIIQPNSGLYVQGAPATAGQWASLYAIGPVDTNPYGGASAGAIPANSNLMFHQGIETSASAAIGPMVSPATAGQYTGNLIEAQVQSPDTNSQSVNFVSSTNVASAGSADRDRPDLIIYQAKLGTATANSSPPIPTVDTGWVAVGQVVIPSGVTAITPPMITTYPAFNGLLSAGSGGAISLGPSGTTWASVTSAGLSTGTLASTALTPGDCVTVDSNHNLTSTSGACGLASGTITNVNGTGNIAATVAGGVATVSMAATPVIATAAQAGQIYLGSDGGYALSRYGASAFGVTYNSGFAVPTFEADGGFIAGNTRYGPTGAVVGGPVSATIFNGSGAGITTGTVPDNALVTPPVQTIGAGSNVAVSGTAANPIVGLVNGPTFSAGVTTPEVSTSLVNSPNATLSLLGSTIQSTASAFAWSNLSSQIMSLSGAGLLTVPTIAATTLNVSGAAAFGATNTAGSAIFGTGNTSGTLGINTGFSATYPVLSNSSQGGLNIGFSSADSWGMRVFGVAPGGALALKGQLDQNGNWTVAGNVLGQGGVFSAVDSLTLGTSTGNGTINTLGAGALYFNYFSGTGGFNFCNGAQACPVNIAANGTITAPNISVSGGVTAAAVTANAITDNGSQTVAGTATFNGVVVANQSVTSPTGHFSNSVIDGNQSVGGTATSGAVVTGPVTTTGVTVNGTENVVAEQIGPNSPGVGNFITHGQSGTYGYVSGLYNGNTHWEVGILESVGGNGGHVGATFNIPFTALPICTMGLGSSSGSAPTTGAPPYITQYTVSNGVYSGLIFLNPLNATMNISYQCVGA